MKSLFESKLSIFIWGYSFGICVRDSKNTYVGSSIFYIKHLLSNPFFQTSLFLFFVCLLACFSHVYSLRHLLDVFFNVPSPSCSELSSCLDDSFSSTPFWIFQLMYYFLRWSYPFYPAFFYLCFVVLLHRENVFIRIFLIHGKMFPIFIGSVATFLFFAHQ